MINPSAHTHPNLRLHRLEHVFSTTGPKGHPPTTNDEVPLPVPQRSFEHCDPFTWPQRDVRAGACVHRASAKFVMVMSPMSGLFWRCSDAHVFRCLCKPLGALNFPQTWMMNKTNSIHLLSIPKALPKRATKRSYTTRVVAVAVVLVCAPSVAVGVGVSVAACPCLCRCSGCHRYLRCFFRPS